MTRDSPNCPSVKSYQTDTETMSNQHRNSVKLTQKPCQTNTETLSNSPRAKGLQETPVRSNRSNCLTHSDSSKSSIRTVYPQGCVDM